MSLLILKLCIISIVISIIVGYFICAQDKDNATFIYIISIFIVIVSIVALVSAGFDYFETQPIDSKNLLYQEALQSFIN